MAKKLNMKMKALFAMLMCGLSTFTVFPLRQKELMEVQGIIEMKPRWFSLSPKSGSVKNDT